MTPRILLALGVGRIQRVLKGFSKSTVKERKDGTDRAEAELLQYLHGTIRVGHGIVLPPH